MANISKLLQISKIDDPKKDKNGILYKRIEVSTSPMKLVVDLFTMKQELVKDKVKTGTFNAFQHRYIDLANKAKELGVEIKNLKKADIADIKPDFGYDNLEVGDKVQGDIVTRKVEPYEILDENTGEMRVVDYYTTPVLGDTEDQGFDQVITQTFRRNQRSLYSDKLGMGRIVTEETKKPAEVFAEVEQ